MITYICTRCNTESGIAYTWPLPKERHISDKKEVLCETCMDREDADYKRHIDNKWEPPPRNFVV